MKMWIRGAAAGMTGFFIAVALLLSLLSGTARSQPPGHRIGVNPTYPIPAKETPAGIEANSATLVENANLWNGRIVAFKGEAIGECMVRGEMAWLHLNDDAYMEKKIEEGAVLGGYNSGHAVWVSAVLVERFSYIHFNMYWLPPCRVMPAGDPSAPPAIELALSISVGVAPIIL